jgi:hypothetical protein
LDAHFSRSTRLTVFLITFYFFLVQKLYDSNVGKIREKIPQDKLDEATKIANDEWDEYQRRQDDMKRQLADAPQNRITCQPGFTGDQCDNRTLFSLQFNCIHIYHCFFQQFVLKNQL